MKTIKHKQMKMIHFAPEKFLSLLFKPLFALYETADIEMPGVDH